MKRADMARRTGTALMLAALREDTKGLERLTSELTAREASDVAIFCAQFLGHAARADPDQKERYEAVLLESALKSACSDERE